MSTRIRKRHAELHEAEGAQLQGGPAVCGLHLGVCMWGGMYTYVRTASDYEQLVLRQTLCSSPAAQIDAAYQACA